MYYTVIKHSGHLRTLEKCRIHSPAARVVHISLVFSNARRVLSQCNTRLRLLYLLNIYEALPADPVILFLSFTRPHHNSSNSVPPLFAKSVKGFNVLESHEQFQKSTFSTSPALLCETKPLQGFESHPHVKDVLFKQRCTVPMRCC